MPNERIEAIKERFMKPAIERNIPVDGTIKEIGRHKVIWIVRSGDDNKTIDVDFVENKYIWDFHVGVPTEYYETMVVELEKIIDSFSMI